MASTSSMRAIYSSSSSATHHIFFPPRLEIVTLQQHPDGLSTHARNQFALHRFRRDQPHAPPRLPGGRGAAHHGNDALALTLLQPPLLARTRLLCERLLQTLFLPAPGNGPHRLGGDRQIPRHLRRRLPLVQLVQKPGPPQHARRLPPLVQHPGDLLPLLLRQLHIYPMVRSHAPIMPPTPTPNQVPDNIPLHVVRDLATASCSYSQSSPTILEPPIFKNLRFSGATGKARAAGNRQKLGARS